MRKTILLFALLITVNASGQNVKLDTPTNTAYAEIDPIEIGWLKDAPNVTRLYVNIVNFNLVNSTYFNWWLKYPIVIDKNTVNYQSIMSGGLSLPVNISASIGDARAYIFNFIADSMNLNVKFK